MPRGDQITRLYGLIADLAKSRRGVPVSLLAKRHRARPRTVYRDLHALQEAGFPVTPAGSAKWKLLDGWKDRIPFPLPIGQLLALHLARGLTKPLRGTRAARDLDLLARRLSGTSSTAFEPETQGDLFPKIRALIETPSALAIDYTRHEAAIEILCRACESSTVVRAVYLTESRREVTQRLLDPYALYFDPRLEALYVFAWCHSRKAVRTFAAHRFQQVSLTKQRFERLPSFSVERHLEDAFQIWRSESSIAIRLRLAPTHRWVAERNWHASQKKKPLRDGSTEIAWTVADTVEVRRFILGLGTGVEVLEPAGLRREIAEEHAEAARIGRRKRGESESPDDKISISASSRGARTRLLERPTHRASERRSTKTASE